MIEAWAFSVVLTFTTFGGGGTLTAAPTATTEALCNATRKTMVRMLGGKLDQEDQEVFVSEDGNTIQISKCRKEK